VFVEAMVPHLAVAVAAAVAVLIRIKFRKTGYDFARRRTAGGRTRS
jgi:hypothetical protein